MAPSSQASAAPVFVRVAAHPLRWQVLTALADSDYRVRDLMTMLDEPQNLLSYHLRQLRDSGLVTATRSSNDGRDSYYHLDLDRCAAALAGTAAALHPSLGTDVSTPTRRRGRQRPRPSAVLFVCTGNSIRSPIAEALMRHHGGDQVSVTSAGTRPRPALHPNTVQVLGEQFGIDVASQPTRDVDLVAGRRFDRVVTLCDRAREGCPAFAQDPRRSHWSIHEPAMASGSDKASYPAFRQVAEDIDTRVRHLLPALTATNL